MNITSSTKLNEVYGSPSFSKVKDLLVSGTDFFSQNGELTFAELQGLHPTWFSEDLVFGISRLQELASSRNQVAYPVYSSADAEKSSRIANVNLLFFPAERKTCDTYVILLAGGAYEAVCTMIEALPVAAKLNELGVTCFCLNYRTFSDESFVNGLLPEPLDDLAAGWRFIEQNQEIFGVSANDYIVGGFSAGGHVASLWGTTTVGARKYGIPQPKMIMLAYPLLTMENRLVNPRELRIRTGMFGQRFTLGDIQKYDPARVVDGGYPKTYAAVCLDDTEVYCKDAVKFGNALKSQNVPFRLDQAEFGGHGFGLGSATALKGWPERALLFMNA